MFEPNLVGKLERMTGRNIHGSGTYDEGIDCPFSAVNLDVVETKTIVRADSSASRGSADERVTEHAQILIAPYVTVSIGDRFLFDGLTFRISAKHTRRSVLGTIDHHDCKMEVIPA